MTTATTPKRKRCQPISVWVKEDIRDQFEEFAARLGVNRNLILANTIRALLAGELDAEKLTAPPPPRVRRQRAKLTAAQELSDLPKKETSPKFLNSAF